MISHEPAPVRDSRLSAIHLQTPDIQWDPESHPWEDQSYQILASFTAPNIWWIWPCRLHPVHWSTWGLRKTGRGWSLVTRLNTFIVSSSNASSLVNEDCLILIYHWGWLRILQLITSIEKPIIVNPNTLLCWFWCSIGFSLPCLFITAPHVFQLSSIRWIHIFPTTWEPRMAISGTLRVQVRSTSHIWGQKDPRPRDLTQNDPKSSSTFVKWVLNF